MRGSFGGPEAETIVVLGREHDGLEARRLCRARPLPSVEIRWRKGAGIFLAVSPLAPAESVDAEVEEERAFLALLAELIWGRDGVNDATRHVLVRTQRAPDNDCADRRRCAQEGSTV